MGFEGEKRHGTKKINQIQKRVTFRAFPILVVLRSPQMISALFLTVARVTGQWKEFLFAGLGSHLKVSIDFYWLLGLKLEFSSILSNMRSNHHGPKIHDKGQFLDTF